MAKTKKKKVEEEEVVTGSESGTPISGHPDYDQDLPDNKQRDLR